MTLECLQEWRLHYLSVHPVPAHSCPHSAEVFPDVQMESPSVDLVTHHLFLCSMHMSDWGAQTWAHGSNCGRTSGRNSISLLCCRGIVLAHGQLGVLQDYQGVFSQGAFQLGSPHCILVPGVAPPLVQDFALPLVELQQVSVSPFLQPLEVIMDGSTTHWSISHS